MQTQEPVRPVLVPFRGGALAAVRSGGHAWLVLRPACEALGIDEEGQRKRLLRLAWATASMMEAVGADGRRRQMFCLRADRMAMWLATIDASRVENPEARKLIELWQCEAADALDRWARGSRTDEQDGPQPRQQDFDTYLRQRVQEEVSIQLDTRLSPSQRCRLRGRRRQPSEVMRFPIGDIGQHRQALQAVLASIEAAGMAQFLAVDVLAMLRDMPSLAPHFAMLDAEYKGLTLHRLGNWLRKMRNRSLPSTALVLVAGRRTQYGMVWTLRPAPRIAGRATPEVASEVTSRVTSSPSDGKRLKM